MLEGKNETGEEGALAARQADCESDSASAACGTSRCSKIRKADVPLVVVNGRDST